MSKYSVDDLLQEADEAVSNPNWTIATSKRAELYLPGALGAAALGAAAVGGAAALEAAALGGAGALGLGAGALLGPAFAVVAIGLGANAINKRKKQQRFYSFFIFSALVLQSPDDSILPCNELL